jgi:hypothetical protein
VAQDQEAETHFLSIVLPLFKILARLLVEVAEVVVAVLLMVLHQDLRKPVAQ